MIDWLLDSAEPLVRYRALVELAGASARDQRVVEARRGIADGPIVRTLLNGRPDAGGPRHPYAKWGALMDLGTPADLPGAREALAPVLPWRVLAVSPKRLLGLVTATALGA